MKKPYFLSSGLSDITDVTFFVFSPGVKERNSVSPLTDFDIPTSFWYELKSLTEALMDNVKCELSETKHFLLETEGSAASCHDDLPQIQNTVVHFGAV